MITQRLGPVLYAHYKLLSKITEALCGSRQPYLLLVSTARTDLHNRYDQSIIYVANGPQLKYGRAL